MGLMGLMVVTAPVVDMELAVVKRLGSGVVVISTAELLVTLSEVTVSLAPPLVSLVT